MSSQTVVPSSHLTSGLLDGLYLTLNFSYTWAGVACLVVFIVYTSTRPKNQYVTVLRSFSDMKSYRLSECYSSSREDWSLYILSRCHTVLETWKRVCHGGLCQGERQYLDLCQCKIYVVLVSAWDISCPGIETLAYLCLRTAAYR